MKSAFGSIALAIIFSAITNCSAYAADCKLDCVSMGDEKRADKVEVRSCGKDKAEVEITRKFGIGGSNLTFHGDSLPKKLVLKFKKFDNLESFGIICGQKRINSSLKMASNSKQKIEIPTGNNLNQSKKTQSELEIHMKVDKDHITVDIPCQTFMGTNREITISWIDWYRH